MSDDVQSAIATGAAVYDRDGNELGVITELTSEGFEVSMDGETDGESLQEHEPGQEFGEGYIMWRCHECGEMGELDDGLPNECPSCGAENVVKWRED